MSTLDQLRLARTDGIGPITFRRLREIFPDPTEAIANLPQIARKAGRATPLAVPSRDEAAAELQALQRMGGCMVFLGDSNYPGHLAELGDSPAALAVLGDVALLNARSIAVVGARNASLNGKSLATSLATDLAAAGLVIVSGLARGIDAAAHEAALRAGRTIAVVAGGLDSPYPPEHAKLQARIATTGAVIAEAPLGTAPISRHFPRRNRIVAGLTLGVVVIEAALRSGSLITARLAGDAGREVFAVPGSPLDPRCRGSNGLLREGATLTETAADVLQQLTTPHREVLGFAEPLRPALMPEPGQGDVEMVISLLGADPCVVDDLIRDCQLPASTVLTVLADLELAGRLETLPGARIALLPGADRP